MTYRAPGLQKARLARNSRAYRARKREAARCSECHIEITQIDACTCQKPTADREAFLGMAELRAAPKPLRKRSVIGGVH